MNLAFAKSWLRGAKRHVQENDRYRWWPVYAAGLTGVLHILYYWPMDLLWIMTRIENPWTLAVSQAAWDCAVALAVMMAVVAMVRRSWLGRGLSVYALWFGGFYMMDRGPLLANILFEIKWFLWGSVGADIHALAGEGTALAALLWCCYVMVVWLIVRPVVRRVFPKVAWFEDWARNRAPRAKALARSLM